MDRRSAMTPLRAIALGSDRGLLSVGWKANRTSSPTSRLTQIACGSAFRVSQYVGAQRPPLTSSSSVDPLGMTRLHRRAYLKANHRGSQVINQSPVVCPSNGQSLFGVSWMRRRPPDRSALQASCSSARRQAGGTCSITAHSRTMSKLPARIGNAPPAPTRNVTRSPMPYSWDTRVPIRADASTGSIPMTRNPIPASAAEDAPEPHPRSSTLTFSLA